jgi:DNA end-binding protein Ku
MRAIWSGTISFGLVNIPVRMYPATEPRRINFDMLHRGDLSPVGYLRVCRQHGEEVPWDEIVKGYEYKKGDYVILTDEDFRKADVEKTESLEILDFADQEEIDSVYFEKPYYLEPGKGADRMYALLHEALKKTGKVGICRYVLRTTEHLGILKIHGDMLILNQMRFATEIRKPDELKLPKKPQVRQSELDMAIQLVKQLSKRFDPAKYRDTYTQELKDMIREKAAGKKEIKPKGKEPVPTEVDDLMEKLKASLKEKSKSDYAYH